MNNDVTEVSVRAVLPMEHSCAVFLGNDEKTFVIYVQEQAGQAISMALRHMPTERPMTHELMSRVLRSFGASVERVIINAVSGQVFYARLIISAENELHARKVVELDARPSDSIVLAVQANAPIYVSKTVFSTVSDASDVLQKVQSGGLDPIQSSALSALSPAGASSLYSDDNTELSESEEAEIDEILAELPDIEGRENDIDEDDDDDFMDDDLEGIDIDDDDLDDEDDDFDDLDDDDDDDSDGIDSHEPRR
jgi:hypothetical protein